jgi:hypothetical protein
MDKLITQICVEKIRVAPDELTQIIHHIAAAPFATDLLPANAALWGSFWRFDVISAGYRLPAVELNLLRGIRLDGAWPEGATVEEYLADLREAIRHPQAGVWTLLAAQQPCVIFAAPTKLSPQNSLDLPLVAGQAKLKIQNLEFSTVVWYCASTGKLHAGYRASAKALRFADGVEQRSPGYQQQRPARFDKPGRSKNSPPGWLASTVEQMEPAEAGNLAARLDAEILRLRLGN